MDLKNQVSSIGRSSGIVAVHRSLDSGRSSHLHLKLKLLHFFDPVALIRGRAQRKNRSLRAYEILHNFGGAVIDPSRWPQVRNGVVVS
jgi:hypothetical protein